MSSSSIGATQPLHTETSEGFKERRLKEQVEKMADERLMGGEAGYRKGQLAKIEKLVAGLFQDSRNIEDQIINGESSIFFQTEDSFFTGQDLLQIQHLKAGHQRDVVHLRELQEQSVVCFTRRHAAKRFYRDSIREAKLLAKKTSWQRTMSKEGRETRDRQDQYRNRYLQLVDHLEDRHIKQIKQFSTSEDRKFADQVILTAIQVRHLNDDLKSLTWKAHQSKVYHQNSTNKKKVDQMRDLQRVELRHIKEMADAEMVCRTWTLTNQAMMETLFNLKTVQSNEQQSLSSLQRTEYTNEKERMTDTAKTIKLLEIQNGSNTELSALKLHQRELVRVLQRAQKISRQARLKRWSEVLGRDLLADEVSGLASGAASGAHSRFDPVNDVAPDVSVNVFEKEHDVDGQVEGLVYNNRSAEQLETMKLQLLSLREQQERLSTDMIERHKDILRATDDEYVKQKMELNWTHDIEIKLMRRNDDVQIAEAVEVQERELRMEEMLRGGEGKALQERRILNSLLDSIVDGVISIDPRGFIIRFNVAAEKQFGYTSSKVIGRNVKDLMPTRYSDNHDEYLYNYLSTGLKKVIGTGRTVYGMRSDGTEFPLSLSISEVIEDGFHLFTAVTRDLTADIEAEKVKSAESDCLPQMVWKIDRNGNASNLNKRFLDYTGISRDKIHSSNIFDRVHPADLDNSKLVFAEANKTKEPFEVKRRLLGVSGTFKWFLTRGSPIFDQDNEVSAWCGSCTDIDATEKLQAELQILPESLPQLLWKIDLEGEVVYSNSKFQAYLGVSKGMRGVNVFSAKVVHPDDVARSRRIFDEAVNQKKSFEMTRRIKGIDGKYRYFVTRAAPIIDLEGNLTSFYGTCTDINESQELAREMTLLPESLPQMVWKINGDGDVLYANRKFKEFVGAVEGQALNVFSDKIVHKDDVKQSIAAFKLATREKGEFETKRRLLSTDGGYRRFETRGVPFIDEQGNILCWYGTCTDMNNQII